MENIKIIKAIDEAGPHGIHLWKEIDQFIEKHNLRQLGGLKIVNRAVSIPYNLGSINDAKYFGDNKIYEILVWEYLVGFIYLRRDDLNWTECTIIAIQETIDKLKEGSLKWGALLIFLKY